MKRQTAAAFLALLDRNVQQPPKRTPVEAVSVGKAERQYDVARLSKAYREGQERARNRLLVKAQQVVGGFLAGLSDD